MYIENGTVVYLICDIESDEDLVLVKAGTRFYWDNDSTEQIIDGVSYWVEVDEVEVVGILSL